MVATHNEGMPLHLSAASTSGYQYVVAKPSGKFQASVKGQFLGSFDTALEAAVCVATHLSLPKDPPSAARGAKRALLTAEARGGKRQQLQQRQAPPPAVRVPTDPHRRPTAAAGASTAAGARRRPEPQATNAPSAAPTSSRSLMLAPASAAVPPAALAPGQKDRAPGDRNGKEICVGSRVLDGQERRGEIVKRCGAWLTMRSDAGEEFAVRRRSVEVIDAEEAEPPPRALVARRDVAPPAAPSAPLRVAAAPAARPPAAQPAITARDRWRQAIAPPIPPADVFVGIFFDSASGGWCFHAAGRTTHGFPSALAALAACEAQESPQVTVPATHSSMRVAS
jgi:hypothetical protein